MDNLNKSMMIWIPVAAIIGAAIGAAVGLLYAPKEGKATRQYIRDRTIRMREQAMDAARRIRFRVPFKHHPAKENSPVAM